MNRFVVIVALAASLAARPEPAFAQSTADRFELGGQIASVSSSQFDDTDVGFGGRFSWHPQSWLGVEGELNLYPREFPARRAFSRERLEGLFGATVGPAVGRVRPFARVRSGFLNVRGKTIACILIFPPPLSCVLASGRTLAALDVGGGLEILATQKSFLRVDLGDLVVRYPRTVFDGTGTIRDRPFASHNFRVAGGVGVRF